MAPPGQRYSTFSDLSGNTPSASGVPDIEDADPNEAPMAKVPAAPTINIGSEKLDQYRICGRCQGSGEYKKYFEMGPGCTREVTVGCDSDIDGAPCDGGIVPKNWTKEKAERAEAEKKLNKKVVTETSGGKFDGRSEPCVKTQEAIASMAADREIQASQALQGAEPVHRVTVQPAASEDEDAWLQVAVELPLVVSASAIEAYVEHMRFLVLEVPGVYSLRTKLPHYVDDEDMECNFNTSSQTLTIRMPVVESE